MFGLNRSIDTSYQLFQRLPGPVAHAAEALWLTACTEARQRVEAHWRDEGAKLKFRESEQAVRTQVLSLREQEFKAQLAERDKTIDRMNASVQGMTSLLKKEMALRESDARRVVALQEELSKVRDLLGRLPEPKQRLASKKKASVKTSTKTAPIAPHKRKINKQKRPKKTKRHK